MPFWSFSASSEFHSCAFQLPDIFKPLTISRSLAKEGRIKAILNVYFFKVQKTPQNLRKKLFVSKSLDQYFSALNYGQNFVGVMESVKATV